MDINFQVEVTRLKPFTTYYYQFNVCGTDNTSPLGRTKTSPRPKDKTKEIKFAVHSCSNYRKFAVAPMNEDQLTYSNSQRPL